MKLGLLWLFICMLIVACAQGQAVIEPPTIHYGEDLCAECGMIISDPRFASGYLYEISPDRYESLAFDDIGDMLVHAAQHPEHPVRAWYVHDYTSEEWLDATQAHYVVSNAILTPMGHGVIAFTTPVAAQAKASELAGEVLDWPALLQRYHVAAETNALFTT